MTKKDQIELWLKSIGLLFTVAGLVWGLYQFTDLVHQRRVDATLRYVERFGEKPVLDARRELSAAWRSARPRLAVLRNTPTSREEYAQRHRQLVFSVVHSDPPAGGSLEADISLLVAFYEELAVCKKGGLCDDATVRMYFATEAASFFCLYEPYFEWTSNTYAEGFGSLIKEHLVVKQHCY